MFSSAGNEAAFGWGSWELDKTVGTLCHAAKMQEILMVAVDNSPARVEEYNGLHHVDAGARTTFEDYEAFLIFELKPRIDSQFRTLPGTYNTAVMGSSLGGLCSLVLAWDQPEIFGNAASLSGAFRDEHPNFLDDVLKRSRGSHQRFRVYLDSGIKAYVADDGRARTKQVEAELRRLGWTTEQLKCFVDTKTLTLEELQRSGLRRDKWGEARVSQHNEFYWRRRAWRALTFLFPPSEP
jgi:enterochelin esterase-like enzyme